MSFQPFTKFGCYFGAVHVEEQLQTLSAEVTALKRTLSELTSPKHGENTVIGAEVFIDPTCSLVSNKNATIEIGEKSNVWKGAQWVGPIKVGKRVFINQDSYIRPGVTLEDDVSIGPFVRLITDTHEISSGPRRTGAPRKDRILIKKGSWVGSCAQIMGGVTVGERSIVAAGAVVTCDVPDNVVIAGVPARIIRHIRDTDNVAELVKANVESIRDQNSLGENALGKEMLEIVTEFVEFRDAVATAPELFTDEEVKSREDEIGDKFAAKLREFISR